jgi:hypothetical protein
VLAEADVVRGSADDLLALAADRPAQRRRDVGRRGGRRRRQPGHQPQAPTTSTRSTAAIVEQFAADADEDEDAET